MTLSLYLSLFLSSLQIKLKVELQHVIPVVLVHIVPIPHLRVLNAYPGLIIINMDKVPVHHAPLVGIHMDQDGLDVINV